MYCNHYGFTEKPFDVTPDPRFLFLSGRHQETLASIIYGIKERRGFITVIGEVGTGKTTLLNAAMDRLDEKTRVAFIFNTDVTFDQMLNMALYEWGLTNNIEKLSKVEAIQRLNRFAIEQLTKGGNVVLIVDEAQNLDHRVMENLRLLSNLETRRHKLIQIVLCGQPELDTKLCRHELRQLTQRINLWGYIFPLNEKDTYAYLQHRLKVVQESGAFPFDPKAKKLIWNYSKGVPRKINILCDNAFLIGYALKMKKINGAIMREAAQDLKWHISLDDNVSPNVSLPGKKDFALIEATPPRRSFIFQATMVISGILVLAGSLFINSSQFNSAKLFDFISGIKSAALEIVHQEKTKATVQISLPDISEQVVVAHRTVKKKIAKDNPEPENQEKNLKILPLTLSGYHLVEEKKSDLIFQDNETENMSQVTKLDEFDQSNTRDIEKEKQNLSAPRTQLGGKEKLNIAEPVKENKITRNIVVRAGDTLGRIISQIYGTYSDMRLFKVQQQNPDIIDPDLILPGQVIKLPIEPAAIGSQKLEDEVKAKDNGG